mmetsp:Transcript_45779/g.99446  ORF Transcript_45779/g.99446 Transcript_45779/m.99446 type:complete len:270 (+) Transcript_45779:508-1317(+)
MNTRQPQHTPMGGVVPVCKVQQIAGQQRQPHPTGHHTHNHSPQCSWFSNASPMQTAPSAKPKMFLGVSLPVPTSLMLGPSSVMATYRYTPPPIPSSTPMTLSCMSTPYAIIAPTTADKELTKLITSALGTLSPALLTRTTKSAISWGTSCPTVANTRAQAKVVVHPLKANPSTSPSAKLCTKSPNATGVAMRQVVLSASSFVPSPPNKQLLAWARPTPSNHPPITLAPHIQAWSTSSCSTASKCNASGRMNIVAAPKITPEQIDEPSPM